MNRTLRRPMFRIGGTAEGITSGLQPRQGYATNKENLVRPNDPSKMDRGLSDFLISFGLDLASRPKGGNIFQQVATSAKGPFEQFQARRAAGEDRDWRREWEQEGRDIKAKQFEEEMGLKREGLSYEKERDIADRELQEKLGVLEAQGEKEFIVQQISAYWDPLIEAATDPKEIEKLEESKRADIYDVIVLGSDISDKYKILTNEAAYSLAVGNAEIEIATLKKSDGTPWTEGDTGYGELLQKIINKYLRLATKFLDPDKKASGGRVGRALGGGMTEDVNVLTKTPGGISDINVSETVERDPGETKEINISYDQLRDRLPPQISDNIVLLLSQSYEAFADFAEIQTQADDNEFNTKYNVQLFLPKQSEA